MDIKDLIVIGAGPGGYDVAVKAAMSGLSVVLIEKEEIGGTCLNAGCIPTKALYHHAHLMNQLKSSEEFGLVNLQYELDFNQVMNRKNEVINQLKHNIKQMLIKANVEIINGVASFVDECTVKVNDTFIQGNHILIATGSKEKIIPIEGYNHPHVLTSKEILKLKELPKKLVIIGGGVIGVEMASVFSEFGTKVVIFEYMDRLIPLFDEDISSRLKIYLKKQGVEIYNEALVEGITELDGQLVIKAKNKKGKEIVVDTEYVLMSTGRVANYEHLNLDQINILTDKKGIVVNDYFQTTIPHIYAVGDVIGKTMLAHTATFQSYKALDHILGKDNHTNFTVIPSCVFTLPEIASVGLTEIEAKSIYTDIKVNKFLFRANGKALTMGDPEGFVKVIANHHQLIGVHIIGPHASTLIHEATLIIEKGLDIRQIVEVIHAHPTLSEALLEAIKGLIE